MYRRVAECSSFAGFCCVKGLLFAIAFHFLSWDIFQGCLYEDHSGEESKSHVVARSSLWLLTFSFPFLTLSAFVLVLFTFLAYLLLFSLLFFGSFFCFTYILLPLPCPFQLLLLLQPNLRSWWQSVSTPANASWLGLSLPVVRCFRCNLLLPNPTRKPDSSSPPPTSHLPPPTSHLPPPTATTPHRHHGCYCYQFRSLEINMCVCSIFTCQNLVLSEVRTLVT